MSAHQHPGGQCPYQNGSDKDENSSNIFWYQLGSGTLGFIGLKVYRHINDN